jgi:hypothetical protein
MCQLLLAEVCQELHTTSPREAVFPQEERPRAVKVEEDYTGHGRA